jgi:hypothetical protein
VPAAESVAPTKESSQQPPPIRQVSSQNNKSIPGSLGIIRPPHSQQILRPSSNNTFTPQYVQSRPSCSQPIMATSNSTSNLHKSDSPVNCEEYQSDSTSTFRRFKHKVPSSLSKSPSFQAESSPPNDQQSSSPEFHQDSSTTYYQQSPEFQTESSRSDEQQSSHLESQAESSRSNEQQSPVSPEDQQERPDNLPGKDTFRKSVKIIFLEHIYKNGLF